jgi:isopentenyl-diphosphate Delta-isomerase
MRARMRDIVNERDEIVGCASKEEVESQGLICRVCFIMLVNKRGELMLHRRSEHMQDYPLYWSGAAAGHVKFGETYEQAAYREMKEEIGVEARIELVGKFFSEEDRRMVAVFLGYYDGPVIVDPLEVDKVEYYSPAKLDKVRGQMQVTSFVEKALAIVLPRLERA